MEDIDGDQFLSYERGKMIEARTLQIDRRIFDKKRSMLTGDDF